MVDRRRIEKVRKLTKNVERHTDEQNGIGDVAKATLAHADVLCQHELHIEQLAKVCRQLLKKIK